MKNLLSSFWQGINYTTRFSPLINTIKAPILISNGVSVNGSVGDIVDGGSYRYILRNRFIVIIDCESGIYELLKTVTFHIYPSADTERKQLPFL